MTEQQRSHEHQESVEITDLLAPHLSTLLGRAPIAKPTIEQGQQLAASRILVTGAAGSVGRSLSEWLIEAKPVALTLLDNHENSLFQLRKTLFNKDSNQNTRFVLADVRDTNRMTRLLRDLKPDLIFHLAAYKHVPIAEEWPQEFVNNNVLGTWDLAQLAIDAGVKKLIFTSTDKAVNPPNIYGATKRIVELILRGLAKGQHATQFSVVRLVNVVGARGGVIESFARDIAANRPVRITDARMTRYWITVPEALYLIVSAGCRQSTADTLLLDCGDPTGVPDVANRIWELLRKPGQQLTIEYTGIRPGERLAEELCYNSETLRPTSTANILEATRGELPFDNNFDVLAKNVLELKRLAETERVDDLKEHLFGLVAAYR